MNPESPEVVMLFWLSARGWEIVSPDWLDVALVAGTQGFIGRKIQIRWVCPD
jgi:hypothetical protein